MFAIIESIYACASSMLKSPSFSLMALYSSVISARSATMCSPISRMTCLSTTGVSFDTYRSLTRRYFVVNKVSEIIKESELNSSSSSQPVTICRSSLVLNIKRLKGFKVSYSFENVTDFVLLKCAHDFV